MQSLIEHPVSIPVNDQAHVTLVHLHSGVEEAQDLVLLERIPMPAPGRKAPLD